MSITKQTDRVQIQAYGTQGIQVFDQIEAVLVELIAETATVAYRGANAFEFKTKCTTNAVDFGNTCVHNMQRMSEVVTNAVTFIATNLGGASITLEPPVKSFSPPPIDGDTSVESATDGPLRDLSARTTSIYDQITTLFGQNLTAFQNLGADGWVGPEYDQALQELTALTGNINDAIDNSRSVMVSDITNQLTALGFAA